MRAACVFAVVGGLVVYGSIASGAAPARKVNLTREVNEQGYRVVLDLSGQVLALRVPEDRGYGPEGGSSEAPISAKLSDLGTEGFVSAAVLAQKAKQFDDGIYATVELAAEQGEGRFPGKARFLRGLVRVLTESSPPSTKAVAVVVAGAKLGQHDLQVPDKYEALVKQLSDDFSASEVRSKPIGFYTWTKELSDIFRQDRMLQTELEDPSGTLVLAEKLRADPKLRAAYAAQLTLAERLTNPLAYADLRGALADLDRGAAATVPAHVYFLPPSRSQETELVKRLYGNRPIPEGFSLIDELVGRIRAHQISLRPTANSGWYDYESWALEPLLLPEETPEARHLAFDATYKKQLEELFKGILALTRETHIKQLEVPAAGAAAPFGDRRVVIEIEPELSAEPLATYYLRRAESYAFVREVLDEAFGREALQKMHRLTSDSCLGASLADELDQMEGLFYGAHAIVCRQIGMAPLASARVRVSAATAEKAFADWSEHLADDVDISRDCRMMVPVFYDVKRQKTKVWVMLGWSQRNLEIGFRQAPSYAVYDGQGQPAGRAVDIKFHSRWEPASYPVMAEVYVSKILDRDEFRDHCDRWKTRKAILQNLQ